MKVVLTGAGGGHFYPLIAVAEKIKEENSKLKILDLEIFYLSDKEYNKNLLEEHKINFIKIPAGKLRLYFSLKNFLDPFKTILGFFIALFRLFIIYPDVVFAKGGYSSVPVVLAAKCLFIPVVIHESDSAPGRTNLLTGKLSKRVAVSYEEAMKYFNPKKTAYTGQPILNNYLPSLQELAEKKEKVNEENFLKSGEKQTIIVLGGSQGSEIINNTLLEALPFLLRKYKIIHQVGKENYNKIKISTDILLKNDPDIKDYHFFAFGDLSKYYKSADFCITRAGSTLFELSAWGIPSLIIPITNSNNNHQMKNAYHFKELGCSLVIEERNLRRNIFINSIESVLDSQKKYKTMQENNINSFKSGAAEMIAKEIIKISISHSLK